MNAVLLLRYQQIYLSINLNQTTLKNQDDLNINGTLTLETFLKGCKHVELSYEIKKIGSDLKSFIYLRQNSIERIQMCINGIMHANNVSLNLILNHNFSRNRSVEAKFEYKKTLSNFFIRSNISTDGIEILTDSKLKLYPFLKMKIKILSKKFSPASLQIYFENSDLKNVFKSELKHQNTQIAGFYFQYSFQSMENVKLIARGKYFLNKIEFDFIKRNTLNSFVANLFIENETIFLATYHWDLVKVSDRINTKIRGKLQSKYNLPKISYLKEEESSHSLNNTKFIFTYDDLEANMSILSQTVSPHCMENLYLINTNIEIVREGKLHLIGNKTDELESHISYVKLNDKFISIYLEHNLSIPRSLSIRLEGPWGKVELQGEVFSRNGGYNYRLTLKDTKDQITEINVEFASNQDNMKLLVILRTPLFEDVELLFELKKENRVAFLFLCKGSQSYLNYAKVSGEIFRTPSAISWNIKILSEHFVHFIPDLEIIGGIQHDPDFLKMALIEKLDGFMLTFQIKSNTFEIKNSFQLTYNINVNTHLIEMKTTRNENQYIDFTVSANMISKELKANFSLNKENIFAMNVLLEDGQSFKFRANFVCPTLEWKQFGVHVSINPSSSLSVEVYRNEKKIEFSGSYTNQDSFVSATASVQSSFHNFGKLSFHVSIDLNLGKIEVLGLGEDRIHQLNMKIELKQNIFKLTTTINLPVLGIFNKEIFLFFRYDVRESSCLFEAKFDEDILNGKIYIKEDSLKLNITTPFRNYEDISIFVREGDTKLESILVVNQNNFTIFAVYNSTMLLLDFSSTVECVKKTYFRLSYRDNIVFSYNNNIFKMNFQNISKGRVNK